MKLVVLLFLGRLGAADLHRVPRPADGTDKTLLCRARLADGHLHPGTADAKVCRLPQKGAACRCR